jgi:excinuclease ABC subunit C
LHRKLALLAKARRDFTFVYAVPGYDGCHTWYLLHCGEIAAAAAAPRNAQDYAALKPTLQQWAAMTANRLDRGHGAFPHTLGIVASWFRKHRQELDRTFATEQAGRKYRAKSLSA